MKFHAPLIEGRLVQRYKRFFADVKLPTGEIITAHCANSGSMLSVKEPNARVWVSPAANPDRKLKFTWELIEIGDAMVGINTSHPNALVADAIAAGEIPELTGYTTVAREKKYGKNSRIDALLSAPGRPDCYVEVKNVTMRRGFEAHHAAEFPDAVTERGAKHLREMTDMVKGGNRAVMFYLVQRTDGERFRIAADIDPGYAEELKKALKSGVEAICYGCSVTPDGISIARKLTMDLPV